MTTLRAAAEMALDAIETHGGQLPFVVYRNVKGALRAALAEPDWSVTGAPTFDPPSEEYLRQKIADWKKAHGDKGEP